MCRKVAQKEEKIMATPAIGAVLAYMSVRDARVEMPKKRWGDFIRSERAASDRARLVAPLKQQLLSRQADAFRARAGVKPMLRLSRPIRRIEQINI
jgi:hypothetical protein